jgi:hypothetical protein
MIDDFSSVDYTIQIDNNHMNEFAQSPELNQSKGNLNQ